MNVDELGKMRAGARLSGVLPEIQQYTHEQEEKLIQQVIQKLNEGTLTPELALYAWMELATYRKMVKSITTKVRIGVAAGQRISGELEIGA